jgi:hypothetical protein
MGIVRIDQLEPGMVIVSDVVDRNGRVLLSTGTALTAKHLRVFRMWGVTEADIEGIASPDSVPGAEQEEGDRIEEEAAARVSELFARSNRDHPAMAELMRLATAWHTRILRAKKGHGTEAA